MSAMKREPSRTYLLVGVNSPLVARAVLDGPPDARNMQMRIIEGNVDDVVNAEVVQAVPADDDMPMRTGRVILRRGRLVVLEPLSGLSEDARMNLRMPVYFESLIYFEHGGRALIRAADLSCGGIGFYSAATLKLHEHFEVVIPITTIEPSIVKAELLRIQPYSDTIKFYAAKFVELLHEEEARIRGAVFHVQLRRGRVINPK